MADSEKQIGFRGTVEYREKLQRAALDRGLKVQGLIERAVEAFLASPATAKAPADKDGLTEDQRDILAIINDPRKDFLFTSVRSTVTHALEQYRKNFKPKTTAKTKAAGSSRGHERQSTGT